MTEISRLAKAAPLTAAEYDGNLGEIYRFSTGAEQIDGGIVLNAGGESTTQTDTITRTAINTAALGHADVIWNTVSILSGDGLVYNSAVLHAHRMNPPTGPANGTIVPYLNHKTGVFSDVYGKLRDALSGTTVSVSYKYATTGYRWIRNFDGHTASLKWWGVQNGDNVYGVLCHALNTCQRLGVKVLRLDGEYLYSGTIEIPSGIELTDGILRVPPGNASSNPMSSFKPGYVATAANKLNCDWVWMTLASGGTYCAMRRVEIDGSTDENTDPLLNPGSYTDVEGTLRNTPVWGGFWINNHGGRVVPFTTELTLEDVHIHNYGSNCLLTSGCVAVSGRNLKLGNSARNHLAYGVSGDIVGLTLYGYWWEGAVKSPSLHVQNLRLRDQATNPYFVQGGFLFQQDGPDYDGEDFDGDARFVKRGSRVDGFHIELNSNNNIAILFSTLGYGLSACNGTVLITDEDVTSTTGVAGYFSSGEGGNTHLHLSNILVITRGSCCRIEWNTTPSTNFLADHVTFVADSGYSSPATSGNSDKLANFICQDLGLSASYDVPQSYTLRNIDDYNRLFLFGAEDAEAGAPINVYIQDSTFRLDSNTILRGASGTGATGGSNSALVGRVNFFWDRCTFIINPALSSTENRWLFMNLSKFRQCTHFWGTTRTYADTGFPLAW